MNKIAQLVKTSGTSELLRLQTELALMAAQFGKLGAKGIDSVDASRSVAATEQKEDMLKRLRALSTLFQQVLTDIVKACAPTKTDVAKDEPPIAKQDDGIATPPTPKLVTLNGVGKRDGKPISDVDKEIQAVIDSHGCPEDVRQPGNGLDDDPKVSSASLFSKGSSESRTKESDKKAGLAAAESMAQEISPFMPSATPIIAGFPMSDPRPSTTLEMPKKQMGIIIGPAGSVINEIRQLSNTDIKIEDGGGTAQISKVKIVGTDSARQVAQNLIFTRLAQKLPHLFQPGGTQNSWSCSRCNFIQCSTYNGVALLQCQRCRAPRESV